MTSGSLFVLALLCALFSGNPMTLLIIIPWALLLFLGSLCNSSGRFK